MASKDEHTFTVFPCGVPITAAIELIEESFLRVVSMASFPGHGCEIKFGQRPENEAMVTILNCHGHRRGRMHLVTLPLTDYIRLFAKVHINSKTYSGRHRQTGRQTNTAHHVLYLCVGLVHAHSKDKMVTHISHF